MPPQRTPPPSWRLVDEAGACTLSGPGGLIIPLQTRAPRIVRYDCPDRAETVWLIPRAPTGELALVGHWSEEFRAAWAALHARKQARDLDGDVEQAACLAQYLEAGMTQRDMAEEAKMSQKRIDQLLRYARFLHVCSSLSTAVLKIPERRFRQYWQQISDGPTLRSLKGATAYD